MQKPTGNSSAPMSGWPVATLIDTANQAAAAPQPMPQTVPVPATPAVEAGVIASGQVTVTDSPGNSISSNYKVDFDAMDTSGDGNITRAEASGNADLMREFHVVDANANGRLTREEMKGWLD